MSPEACMDHAASTAESEMNDDVKKKNMLFLWYFPSSLYTFQLEKRFGFMRKHTNKSSFFIPTRSSRKRILTWDFASALNSSTSYNWLKSRPLNVAVMM